MGLGGKYIVYTEYLLLLNVRVSLRSFGAFPIFTIFDNLVSQKWLVREQNRPKFGLGGSYLVYIYEVLLTVKTSKAV